MKQHGEKQLTEQERRSGKIETARERERERETDRDREREREDRRRGTRRKNVKNVNLFHSM